MALSPTFNYPNYLLDFRSRCFCTFVPHHSYGKILRSKPASIHLQHSFLTINYLFKKALHLCHTTVGNLRREAVIISLCSLPSEIAFLFQACLQHSRVHTYITSIAKVTLAHPGYPGPVPVTLATHPYIPKTPSK